MMESTTEMEDYRLWGSKLDNVRAALQGKQWFAFDLDDTLHNFRSASRIATEAVLVQINKDHGLDVDVMRNIYRTILAANTSSAFIDGRNSDEYRKERFEALLRQQKVHLVPNDEYLKRLADLYQNVLSQSLSLKPGVRDLLMLLQSMDKKIIIITEGPEDAQKWTVQQLGIQSHIDFIATTNKFKVSKVDGLLEKVMEKLGIAATNLVCIGDNWKRDIEPAVKANIYAIHYAENDDIVLGESPIRVNTHHKICSILEIPPTPSR